MTDPMVDSVHGTPRDYGDTLYQVVRLGGL